MSNKRLINSILLINWYLINIQLSDKYCFSKKKITKDYLTYKISKALSNVTSDKALEVEDYI